MLLNGVAILTGFLLLIWSADRFVIGASGIALNSGVSPLIIGLTIVGFGTSAPEMIVSGVAAYEGTPNLAVGNALGSNITNIALVLGITALVTPLMVHSKILKREYPVMFMIMLIAWALLWDGELSQIDGIILLSGMFALLGFITLIGIKENNQAGSPDPLEEEFCEEIPKDMSTPMAFLWLFTGLLLLLISSRLLVWGAVNIAHTFHVSELVIGLTIIAIGTSLPELAASITSALKGEHEIAIGNIIGSNMFNLLGVLGIPGIMTGAVLDPSVLSRDYPVMIALSVLLFIFAYGFKDEGRLNRFEGGILLICYTAYMIVLYQQSI
ncbi:MAG: calcium/sodium antiporter [gamma proteobacterium symbiont of Lucinoma myriamae]|nr:calcium/sodium antiporter [gamma proteobacterium symbiont of Lucinoma myriamae]MCU7818100.1 calcium/sodium antiporter [gamma proteobacterium symbiont of Lucinoma myriamae]MCU7831755.1 calcium/sodium antiporter [gamma proteobacterium symbiont of Lucinoma myriamae]